MSDNQELLSHIPRLRRYARALTGDSGRADDLVQDTLERALRRYLLWPPRDLRPWLFSIMHNLFVSQLRRPQLLVYEEEPERQDMRQSASFERLELRDMDTALAALPEEQRAVILLIALEELSYAEAAKILGIPAGTVMSRLSRGRDKLRQLLAGGSATLPLKVVK